MPAGSAKEKRRTNTHMNNEVSEEKEETVFVLDSRSKVASALCSQVQVGKAGEHLRFGLTTESWALFIAKYCERALKKGVTPETLARYLTALAVGNMSQVHGAMETLRIGTPGGKSRPFLPAKAAPMGGSAFDGDV